MKEVDEKYLKKIYLNILKAIMIIFYFFILNQAYENVSSDHLELVIEILTMLFLFTAIFIFEKAYKKDNDELAIQGIEILILATYTLTTEHITNKFNLDFKAYSVVASFIFAIYFIFKSIIIYTKGRKELAGNISDIKEIVKKDEPVKKEATKKSEVKKDEENIKKEIKKKENKKTINKKVTEKKINKNIKKEVKKND